MYTLDAAQSSTPMVCAYWDTASDTFVTTGIKTSVDGRVITCKTNHLSSFQVVEHEGGVVTPPSMNWWLIGACVFGFCFFVLIVVLFFDYGCFRRKELPYYPHINATGESCCKICKYSCAYNFPLISLFSYQDDNVRPIARALWFTELILVIFLIDLILFSKDVIVFEDTYTNMGIIAAILGILLIPGSFVIRLLARFAAPIHSRDEKE